MEKCVYLDKNTPKNSGGTSFSKSKGLSILGDAVRHKRNAARHEKNTVRHKRNALRHLLYKVTV
ncbi:MAG: hypothetical protein WCR53_00555 [Bacteroidaceae bacterium]